MVQGMERAGRRLAEIQRAVDEEKELPIYVEKRRSERKEHPLKAEIDALRGYVEWLRYSREGPLVLNRPVETKVLPSEAPAFEARTTLPVATLDELLRFPLLWNGRSVIVEGGEMVHASRGNAGEHWHIISDGTGRIAAVSGMRLEHSHGTLFGVARRTAAGSQLFIEVKNFYPLPAEGSTR